MKKYDVLCLFDPAVDEAKVDAIIKKLEGKIAALGGSIFKIEKKGVRPLASIIQKRKELKEANYINLVVEGASVVPAEITSQLRVTEEVVRFMLSNKIEAPVPPQPKAPAQPVEEEKVEISPSIFLEGEKLGQS